MSACWCMEGVAMERYPYVAAISVADTEVRSGPDFGFYATSLLQQGDKVEVYYEMEDWCAIRPPVGSFSWIGARYVDLGTNNIGTVIADGLASRVGSESTELCETVQVKLKKGEKVLVLDRRETPENTASPSWYKIAPPSGEYRWIPRSALDGDAGARYSRLSPPRRLSQRAGRPIMQVVYETEAPGTASPAPAKQTLRPAAEPRPVLAPAELSPNLISAKELEAILADTPVSAKKTEGASSSAPQLPSLSTKLAENRPETRQRQIASTDPFQIAFEELKTETRVVLTRPTEDWVFETLIHRGNELNKIAPSGADQEKVYHLVESLQRTREVRQEIQRQRSSALMARSPSPVTAGPLASYASPATTTRNISSYAPLTQATDRTASRSAVVTASLPTQEAATVKNHGFDRVGKLGYFEPLPKNHPPYAIVDENEQIVCLVSPATGVDLKQHVGKIVGISGVIGFYEHPDKPRARHIKAQVVGVIEDARD